MSAEHLFMPTTHSESLSHVPPAANHGNTPHHTNAPTSGPRAPPRPLYFPCSVP
ncbi:hypothetical protein FIBSPDRAFT_858368 [Athelia psychrophila]|uniref:Uncharacterized protein n=1 Tax=Athelia psychrophila TaxID=1759441 RepID=A0A166LXP9_9AGAM|nr:hypothetical protein FIBSPDRAFT_858368 [Fibularhizoctonia sp. CBS 109695]